MKKIIAAALSILVGAFGYTIADKELSSRVDELEASVSSMQEEISSLHAREPATEPESTTTEPDIGTDTPDSFLDNFAQFDVTLPDTGDLASITVTLDGSIIDADSRILNGSGYEFTVSGLEPTSILKVFINEKLYYKCNIDFTTTPCRIFNITIYGYEEQANPTTSQTVAVLPNVVGIPVVEALTRLEAAGFNNISFSGVGSTVLNQYPFSGDAYSSNIMITLYLGD